MRPLKAPVAVEAEVEVLVVEEDEAEVAEVAELAELEGSAVLVEAVARWYAFHIPPAGLALALFSGATRAAGRAGAVS